MRLRNQQLFIASATLLSLAMRAGGVASSGEQSLSQSTCNNQLASNPIVGELIEEDADIESQMPLCPSDDEETNALKGSEQLFSDFCIQSRDIIMGDVKRSIDDLVHSLFGLFYRSFELLGIDGVKVSVAAAKSTRNRLKASPRSSQEPEATNLAEDSNDGHNKGGGGGIPLLNGIFGAIGAIHNAIASTVMKRLDDLKRIFGLEKLVGAVGGACAMVDAYEAKIRARFEATKLELAELDESISGLEFDKLQCVTIKRMMRLKGICGFASHLQNPLVKMLLRGDEKGLTDKVRQRQKMEAEMDRPI